MLLGAVPGPIKEGIISARKLCTDQVLYKLCISFQPGGASERSKLLQSITDAKCGTKQILVMCWIWCVCGVGMFKGLGNFKPLSLMDWFYLGP